MQMSFVAIQGLDCVVVMPRILMIPRCQEGTPPDCLKSEIPCPKGLRCPQPPNPIVVTYALPPSRQNPYLVFLHFQG